MKPIVYPENIARSGNYVHVLRGVWNSEGSKVLGVFKSRAGAADWLLTNFQNCASFDNVILESFEVQE